MRNAGDSPANDQGRAAMAGPRETDTREEQQMTIQERMLNYRCALIALELTRDLPWYAFRARAAARRAVREAAAALSDQL